MSQKNDNNDNPSKNNKIKKNDKKKSNLKITDDMIVFIINNELPVNPVNPVNPINPIKKIEIINPKKKKKRKVVLDLKSIKIETINDLIILGERYDSTHETEYNIDLKILNNIIDPLKELNNMIGMKKVKKNIVNHIIYFMQNFHDNKLDLLHTVIQGPPGAGKTVLGKILGKIYYRMGVIKGNNTYDPERKNNDFNFKIVKRSDLIAKYLGQTAIKTQNVIDEASGGVLFIDEAYSLGDSKDGDSFSKECIDTLNQNLTERNDFICFVAGYKDELYRRFFANNRGLERRFNIRYTIEPYGPEDLQKIFLKMIKDDGWKTESEKSVPLKFFKKNHKNFINLGGDMETLLFNCKIEHSKRVFFLSDDKKRILTKKDIGNGFKLFNSNKNKKENKSFLSMYS